MGAYAYYCGVNDIPDEKREDFAKSILALLREGGMMSLHSVELFDTSIDLLSPVEIDSNGEAFFNYSYFEEACHEEALFFAGDSFMESNKLGFLAFNQVVMSCYRLYEYYTQSFGVVQEDALCFDAETVGWMNYVLDRSYPVERPKRLLEVYRLFLNAWGNGKAVYSDKEAFHKAFDLGRAQIKEKAVEWQEFYTLLYVHGGLETVYKYFGIDESKFSELPDYAFSRQLPRMEQFIKDLRIKKKCSLEVLLDLLVHDDVKYIAGQAKETLEMAQELWLQLAAVSAPMLVKAIAAEYGQDFWKLWDKTAQWWKNTPKKAPPVAVPKIPSSQFLYARPHSVIMWGKPRNAETCARTIVPDDNRLLFYGEKKLEFTQNLIGWLEKTAARFNNMLKKAQGAPAHGEYLKELMGVLEMCGDEEENLRILFIKDTFYEFLENPGSAHHRAAIMLLKELVSEIPQVTFKWELEYHKGNVLTKAQNDFLDQRQMLKSYVALLANPVLRREYLGF